MPAIAAITADQFQVRSELQVVHLPTGAAFQTYACRDPHDVLESIKMHWGRGGPAPERELVEQLVRVASEVIVARIAASVELLRSIESVLNGHRGCEVSTIHKIDAHAPPAEASLPFPEAAAATTNFNQGIQFDPVVFASFMAAMPD